jgi:hypothetical protein
VEALQGTWPAIKVPGSPKTDERFKTIRFVVKGNKMTIIDSNPEKKTTFVGTHGSFSPDGNCPSSK